MIDAVLHSRRVIVIIILVAFAAIGTSGCSPADRYKVLTFFFTGVPEPGSELEKDETTGKALAEIAPRKKRRRIFYQEPKFYIHGPYAASECEKCHSSDSAKQFRVGSAKKESSSRSKSRRFGPRLAYPLEQLCITCHSEKSADFAKLLHLSVHEPVAKGKCTECHDPHKSKRQYLLKGDDTIDLCTKACHTSDKLLKAAAHVKNKEDDCLECHNAHVGKTAQLLKSDFDEWSQYNDGD